MLYRYITFKKNKNLNWYVDHIGYSSKLTYDADITGVTTMESLSNYIIKLDKGYDITDNKGNVIYDNDLIKVDKKIFIVKRKMNRKTPTFVNIKDCKECHSILYLNKFNWKLTGNIYNSDLFNLNSLS